MKILIKNVIIVDKNSTHHLTKKDILIEDGQYKTIAEKIEDHTAQIVEGREMYASIGLCDIGTHLGEPGLEHRETLSSLALSGRKGGYTACAVFSNDIKPLQNVSDIHRIKNYEGDVKINLLPLAVLSSERKGTQMVDYLDLFYGGAVGFSDGLRSVDDTGLLMRVMEYTSQIQVPIFHHPLDKYLKQSGLIHEGVVSTSMGMKGVPEWAELHAVHRDILLAEYLKQSIVLHALSSAKAVKAVSEAKAKNIGVSSTVAYLNLIFTDEAMNSFDTNLKVKPVLRAETDRMELIEGLKANTIDAIISNHVPLDEESKKVEFPYALDGAIGLETCCVAVVDELIAHMDMAQIVEKMAQKPRELLKIDMPTIEKGQKADLCLFERRLWTYKDKTVASLSKNSPFLNHNFNTKIVCSLLGDHVVWVE